MCWHKHQSKKKFSFPQQFVRPSFIVFFSIDIPIFSGIYSIERKCVISPEPKKEVKRSERVYFGFICVLSIDKSVYKSI